MCGFAGLLAGRAGIDAEMIQRMGNLIAHRGPDDFQTIYLDTATGNASHAAGSRGEAFAPDLALTFRRLKIIDLSARGAQPMSNADGSIWIVFNGEIYNYVELRAELEAAGERFRSQSDTEVLLRVYEVYGTAGFERLNGMFAAAIWDQRSRQLLLLRDRFGIKPLYYSQVGGDLVFASEIKALLCHPGMPRAFDRRALSEYLTFHFPLANRTLFQGISLLEPGTFAVYREGRLTIEPYWRMEFTGSKTRSLDDAADELQSILKGALKRQIRSDVPLGTYLSGGMDTGAISALAAPELHRFHTFTCGFDTTEMSGLEQHFDERGAAAALAALLGTIHHEETVHPADLARLMPSVLWHMEDPRVGISHQIYKLARVVRQNVTVVLSGTGGDEIFAGYPWRYAPVMGETDPATFADRFYHVWARICSDELRSSLLADGVRRELDGWSPRQGFDEELAPYRETEPLHRALAFEARNFLQGVLLVEDKLTMAHSVEARVPLLDNALVDFVTTLPPDMKYDGRDTKIVLRRALRGILPEQTINARKQGFTPPEATWMRTHSRHWIEGILLSDEFFDLGLFDRDAARRILADHMEGRANHRFLLWSLLCVAWVHRLFFSGENPAAHVVANAPARAMAI